MSQKINTACRTIPARIAEGLFLPSSFLCPFMFRFIMIFFILVLITFCGLFDFLMDLFLCGLLLLLLLFCYFAYQFCLFVPVRDVERVLCLSCRSSTDAGQWRQRNRARFQSRRYYSSYLAGFKLWKPIGLRLAVFDTCLLTLFKSRFICSV